MKVSLTTRRCQRPVGVGLIEGAKSSRSSKSSRSLVSYLEIDIFYLEFGNGF